jgi:hypothetical protein
MAPPELRCKSPAHEALAILGPKRLAARSVRRGYVTAADEPWLLENELK